ncbi:MAG: hypothetical protein RI937_154, partial [Pseudomonadota bacterium]
MIARHLRSLDLLATAVVILDQELRVVHINQPAEVLFGASSRLLEGSYLLEVLDVAEEVEEMLNQASSQMFESKRLQCDWQLPMRGSVELDSTVSVHLEEEGVVLSLELREIAQQRKADREVHQADLTHANKELLRNLAHEIKNPLGGVRGAAQLLDRELPSDELREYTQVIIKEADRLQGLVDQMLAPHRRLRVMESVNIHEVCERVRSLMLAEFPTGLVIKRDYDISIPDLRGDREQLIQVVLNVVRNAAEALAGEGEIVLCSRIARQVTISKKRCRLALDLHV